MTHGRHPILVAAAVFLLAAGASAQTPPTGAPSWSIRVTGEATVTAAPDQAELDIGVVTRGDTAAQAAAANAKETARVLAELKKLAGGEGAIRTVGYSVRPEYRYPREGREPEIAGYVATNTVRVVTPELDQVGALVDVAVGAGANHVQRLQFTLKDEHAAYLEALGEAARRARAEADALAAALGVKVSRILTAVEQQEPVPPRPIETFRTAALAADAPETPVEPGVIDVQARVVLTAEFSTGP